MAIFVKQKLRLKFTIRDSAENYLDISDSASKTLIILKRIGGVRNEFIGEVTNGIEGAVEYTVGNTILDEAGTWKTQCIHVLPNNAEFPSTIKTFKVLNRI